MWHVSSRSGVASLRTLLLCWLQLQTRSVNTAVAGAGFVNFPLNVDRRKRKYFSTLYTQLL